MYIHISRSCVKGFHDLQFHALAPGKADEALQHIGEHHGADVAQKFQMALKRAIGRGSNRASGKGDIPTCPGQPDGAACCWSTAVLRQPARITLGRDVTHCVFCSDDTLTRIMECQGGFQLTKTLQRMKAMDAGLFAEAMQNLAFRRGDVFAADFEMRVDRTCHRHFQKANPTAALDDQWQQL